eukprot:6206113-Pleurochrysis_carterae.AAC.1
MGNVITISRSRANAIFACLRADCGRSIVLTPSNSNRFSVIEETNMENHRSQPFAQCGCCDRHEARLQRDTPDAVKRKRGRPPKANNTGLLTNLPTQHYKRRGRRRRHFADRKRRTRRHRDR